MGPALAAIGRRSELTCRAGVAQSYQSDFRGFTVTELMVVVAVVAIITSLALPSYRTLIEKRQVTSGAEQIAAFLSAVQIESVMRNGNLTVSYSRTDVDDWCLGLTAGTTPCDCNETDSGQPDFCAVDSVHRVFTNANLTYPSIMDSMTGDGNFTFDPVRGVLLDPADTLVVAISSGTWNYALNVEVGPTGRVRICSNASTTQVPGYGLC